MASVVVNGDTSGAVTLSAPAVAGTVTVTLPSTTGTMLTTASTTGISGSAISSGTVPEAYGGTGTSTGYYGFKNRIINGAMVIDQRNAGASVTSVSGGGVYPVDRWEQEAAVGGGVFTIQQSTTAPTGFSNSILYTVTTADTSLAAGDRYNTRQIIEGYNIADFGFGTASAQTVTVSFWVRSSLIGTYCISLKNGTNARSYVANYTINTANTWEQKTVTIAGDTSGTWGTTNGRGIQFAFSLGAGVNAQATANTWSSGQFDCTSSQVNWLGTVSNTFYITGVQLEKGSTATSFDYRPYGTELMLCQRYFYKTFAQNVAPANGLALSTESTVAMYDTTNGQAMYYTYSATMRTTPTITLYRSLSRGVTDGQWAVYNGSVWTSATTTATGVSSVGFTPVVTTGVLTQFAAYLVSGHYTSSAEL
jgi:hypothetical protein